MNAQPAAALVAPETIWSLLERSHGEAEPVLEVRLLRGSHCIKRAKAGQPLLRRHVTNRK